MTAGNWNIPEEDLPTDSDLNEVADSLLGEQVTLEDLDTGDDFTLDSYEID